MISPKSSEEMSRLKVDLQRLIQENEMMRTRLSQNPMTSDFIDQDGCLYQYDAMAFTSLDEMIKVFRRYSDYHGPSLNLLKIMQEGVDPQSGLRLPESVVRRLEASGIRLKERDKMQFSSMVPRLQDGSMDCRRFYLMIKGQSDQSTHKTEESTAPIIQAKPVIPLMVAPQRNTGQTFSKEANMHTAVLDKNVDLLKKKLIEKDKEVADLTKHLNQWKKQALQFEAELKDKINSGKNSSYAVNSTLAARLGRQGENLKQIQDLEEQIKTIRREMTYEINKREQLMDELKDELVRKTYDLNLSQSEAKNLREQLDRIMSSKLQKDQLIEERDKERDVMVSSLMERLERSRKAEEEIRTKLRAIERENIDLKHVKEGIDTRLESMNRELRELRDKTKSD